MLLKTTCKFSSYSSTHIPSFIDGVYLSTGGGAVCLCECVRGGGGGGGGKGRAFLYLHMVQIYGLFLFHGLLL